jgi:flagellar hook-associated protein 3 FlgL
MRVTTAGQTQAIIARLQASSQALERAQQRATSGRRIERMSDDPTAGTSVMQAPAGLRGVAQYTRNAQRVSAALDAEDSALQQITDLLARARELGVAANSANVDAAGPRRRRREVRALFGSRARSPTPSVGDDVPVRRLTNDGRAPFATPAALRRDDPPPAGAPPARPRAALPDGTRCRGGRRGQRCGRARRHRVFLGRTAAAARRHHGVLPRCASSSAAMRAP